MVTINGTWYDPNLSPSIVGKSEICDQIFWICDRGLICNIVPGNSFGTCAYSTTTAEMPGVEIASPPKMPGTTQPTTPRPDCYGYLSFKCGGGPFSNSFCMPEDFVCDSVFDCFWGEDEDDCK